MVIRDFWNETSDSSDAYYWTTLSLYRTQGEEKREGWGSVIRQGDEMLSRGD